MNPLKYISIIGLSWSVVVMPLCRAETELKDEVGLIAIGEEKDRESNVNKARTILTQTIDIQIQLYRNAMSLLALNGSIDKAKYGKLFDDATSSLRACYTELHKLEGLKKQHLELLFTDLRAKEAEFNEVHSRYVRLKKGRKDLLEIGQAEYQFHQFGLNEQEKLLREPFK